MLNTSFPHNLDKQTSKTAEYSYPSNQALQHYFDELMCEEPAAVLPEKPLDFEPVDEHTQFKISQADRLLAKASSIANLLTDEPQCLFQPSASPTHALNDQINQTVNKVNSADADITYTSANNEDLTRDISISLKDSLSSRFQVLLFGIANVTIAIPLVELGGIYEVTKISPIAKQPSWCNGILVKGNDKFICVDASAWLVSSQYVKTQQDKEYKFVLQLGKSPYVLCCNTISTTVDLAKEDIKWREDTKNRPWLSGLLKERMCALIDGARMIEDVLA
jgi:purine-binding chemotaxis protein CheW